MTRPITKSLILAALVLAGPLGSGLATPAQAADPVGYALAITAGAVDPKARVPAVNIVTGAGVDTLSVARPTAVLTHGKPYVFTLSSQSNSYQGLCSDSFTLTRVQNGTAVLLDGMVMRTYACGRLATATSSTNLRVIPNSPGPAILTGIVTFGLTPVQVSVPVLIK